MVTFRYFAIAFSLIFLILILELIRQRKLKEQYSILWIVSALVMLLFSLPSGLLEKVSSWLGIYYAPSTLFLLTLLFTISLILHFSIIVTKLSDQNLRLTQELAILTKTVQEMEQKGDAKQVNR